MIRMDSGNRPFGYGNVTAVLNGNYWDDAVAAAPADSSPAEEEPAAAPAAVEVS